MAITYEVLDWFYSNFNVGSPQTATSLSFQNSDVIVHIATFSDGLSVGTVSVSSTGSVNAGDLSWTQFVNQAGGGCVIVGWWAISGATETRSITTSWSSGNNKQISTWTLRHAGAHQTTPVPAGKVFTGAGATSVSQSITPTASGSALWLLVANAATTGTSNTAAGANCTLVIDYAYDTHDVAVIRPTTQPRTDGAAFTLAETHTGSSANWVAFEVQAAGSATVSAGSRRPHRRAHPGDGPTTIGSFARSRRAATPNAPMPQLSQALTGLQASVSAGSLGAAASSALTGAQATTAAGAVTASSARAITGLQATAAAGSLTAASSKALTGLAATGSAGFVGAAASRALSGVQATASAGSIAALSSIPLTGLQASSQIGMVSPPGSTSVQLSGLTATATAGALQSAASVALTGVAATAATGSLSASVVRALTGISATTAAGGLDASSSAALTGLAATSAAGSVAAVQSIVLPGLVATASIGSIATSNAISVPLTGMSAAAVAGSLGPSHALPLSGIEMQSAAGSVGIDREFIRAPAGNGYAPRRRQPTHRPRR